MRKFLTLLIISFFLPFLKADELPYYKRTTLKTDLFHLWNIGCELPVRDRISLDLNMSASGRAINGNNWRRDRRLHLKYHLWPSVTCDPLGSVYVMGGLHQRMAFRDRYRGNAGTVEEFRLNRLNVVAGAGIRSGRMEAWISLGHALFERDNSRVLRNESGLMEHERIWKPGYTISVGLVLHVWEWK